MALVIGRGRGEQVVIGERTLVTVIDIYDRREALLEVTEGPGAAPRRRHVAHGRPVELVEGRPWTVDVTECRHGKVSLAFNVPRDVPVRRGELPPRPDPGQ